ncbi:MAG: 4-hydroxybutyrate dehydrogenase/sulfolactaldehyde 3-reductase [Gammaproteobacteria bacterium]|jgi:4-hydroxybutyrate dehydrogenase/sulfolactaldehyde 3-reductase
MATVGFIGLGVMGLPMTRNIINGGHTVRGFDLSKAARAQHEANGGVAVTSAAQAAQGADLLITMLPNGAIVRDALLGADGALQSMSEDALHIDMSTIHPLECDEIRTALSERGRLSMDAPVGRTSVQAIDGTLLVMAGGTPEQIERARSVLMCMGDTVVDCGGPGMGARMKIINNLMSTVVNALTAEALTLADSLGLSRDLAINVMSGTAAGRGHMTTTYPGKVLSNDLSPVFMVDLARKDLGIALAVGEQTGVSQTLAAAAALVYEEAQANGRGAQDWTALYAMLRKKHLDADSI